MPVKTAMCSRLEAYYLPQAKTNFLVKQRRFHLLVGLINQSYELLKEM